jgi:hypothetical protein
MIVQSGRPAAAKTSQPFVSGFATDAKTAAERGQGMAARQHQFDQLLARTNERKNFPRHDPGSVE